MVRLPILTYPPALGYGMSLVLSRSGEDVSAFKIGHFGDNRLAKVGALLFKRICEKLTVSIKSLGEDRATEVAFNRFLANKKVKQEYLCDELSDKTNQTCHDKSHVLLIQDTVQLTYPSQKEKKSDFGPTGNIDTKGLFVHPGIVVDASSRDVLGVSSVFAWCREHDSKGKTKNNKTIEEKESIRWINTALIGKEKLTNAKRITVISDRESDIFEMYQRVPDEKTDLIIRASHDRNLASAEKLSERLLNTDICGSYEIELPPITGKRKKRQATLDVKYMKVKLKRSEEIVEVNCISAEETSTVPKGEKPISWVLLTTHRIESLDAAKQILTWYTWRWTIEQVFRTMKSKGLQIEESQIESAEKLKKLAILCIAASIKVMALVESRDGNNQRKASDLFLEEELRLLEVLGKKLEGKTEKQKNRYTKNSMAWVAWIIARTGGWNGYPSESPPGPITMLRGLQKFESKFEGWILAQNVCIG